MAAPGSEPRIRVAAVLVIGGRLLLVRHTKHGASYFLLPGGGVEPGESLGHALAREVAEETGVTAAIVRPLFVSDSIAADGSRHVVNLTFLCAARGGPAATSDEAVTGIALVTPEELAGLDLRPPCAEWLKQAWLDRFEVPCAYLGPLWTPET